MFADIWVSTLLLSFTHEKIYTKHRLIQTCQIKATYVNTCVQKPTKQWSSLQDANTKHYHIYLKIGWPLHRVSQRPYSKPSWRCHVTLSTCWLADLGKAGKQLLQSLDMGDSMSCKAMLSPKAVGSEYDTQISSTDFEKQELCYTKKVQYILYLVQWRRHQ